MTPNGRRREKRKNPNKSEGKIFAPARFADAKMKKAQRAAAGCAAQKLAVGKFVNDDPLVGGKEMMQR